MGRKPKVDLTDTYVMDDDVMDEMENLEATTVLIDGLDEEFDQADDPSEVDDQEIEGTTFLIKVKE
jgi:hypothetical protein